MSKRIDNLKISPLHKYYKHAKKIKDEGIKVLDLSSVQPDSKTDISYYQALRDIPEEVNAYGDCKGLQELRIKFSRYYNEKIKITNKYDKGDIQITQGASDAIISLLMSICDYGDTVLIVEPFFCDYKGYCKMLDINILYSKMEDLNLDTEIPNECKAILFCNPNNPSGNILSKKEMQKILEIAEKNDLYIISDEVYSELIYDEFISFASFDYEKIIIVDSVSKKFNNCGARIGAIITKNKKIISDMEKLYDNRISLSNTEQIAVTNMFNSKEKIFEENLELYRDRVMRIEKFFERQNIIKFERPKGGAFFLLTLPVEDTAVLTEWILNNFRKNNTTVLILPASEFYSNNKEKIRLSITNDVNNILEGLTLLIEAIKEYQKNLKG